MRIGTWNLERGGASRVVAALQDQAIGELDIDVLVLTEPPLANVTGTLATVESPRERPSRNECWVRIAGLGAEPIGEPLPYTRLAAVARISVASRSIVVYGAVLPWRAVVHHAPDLALPGEAYLDVFERILRDQVADLQDLHRRYPDNLIVWAGDFNQSLTGPNWTGSSRGRQLLQEVLLDLDMAAWNADAAHAREGACAVDLICGPKDYTVRELAVIPPTYQGRSISDHCGYIATLGP